MYMDVGQLVKVSRFVRSDDVILLLRTLLQKEHQGGLVFHIALGTRCLFTFFSGVDIY